MSRRCRAGSSYRVGLLWVGMISGWVPSGSRLEAGFGSSYAWARALGPLRPGTGEETPIATIPAQARRRHDDPAPVYTSLRSSGSRAADRRRPRGRSSAERRSQAIVPDPRSATTAAARASTGTWPSQVQGDGRRRGDARRRPLDRPRSPIAGSRRPDERSPAIQIWTSGSPSTPGSSTSGRGGVCRPQRRREGSRHLGWSSAVSGPRGLDSGAARQVPTDAEGRIQARRVLWYDMLAPDVRGRRAPRGTRATSRSSSRGRLKVGYRGAAAGRRPRREIQ